MTTTVVSPPGISRRRSASRVSPSSRLGKTTFSRVSPPFRRYRLSAPFQEKCSGPSEVGGERRTLSSGVQKAVSFAWMLFWKSMKLTDRRCRLPTLAVEKPRP